MDRKEFGKRIVAIRSSMGLTQMEFGDICGMSGSQIGLLEVGNRNPTLETMSRIAEGLKMTLGELLGEEKQPFPEQDALYNKIMAIAKMLSPRAKKHTLVIIKEIAKMQ